MRRTTRIDKANRTNFVILSPVFVRWCRYCFSVLYTPKIKHPFQEPSIMFICVALAQCLSIGWLTDDLQIVYRILTSWITAYDYYCFKSSGFTFTNVICQPFLQCFFYPNRYNWLSRLKLPRTKRSLDSVKSFLHCLFVIWFRLKCFVLAEDGWKIISSRTRRTP